jgi:tRNA A-37 threonylcarbamoyl transferase component Bud32
VRADKLSNDRCDDLRKRAKVGAIDHSAIARRLASHPTANSRIVPVEIDGVQAWLKDFDQPSPAEWDRVQRVLFAVSRLHMLCPVPSLSGLQGAENEIASIGRFEEVGARVPSVLWSEASRIVISDIGETIREMQRRLGVSSIDGAVVAAACELSRIHRHGLVHGRPILRNLTWDGQTVGFLDFEERPTDVMPLEVAQARDVLLLLISIARRCEPALVKAFLAAYSPDMRPGVEKELQRVSRAAGPLAGNFGRMLSRGGGRNVRSVIEALTAMRTLSRSG